MGSRILVIDDSQTLRKVVCAILSRHGHEPIAAADGQEALELLARETVSLVLLDFVMPRMNGYQFCRELRANEAWRDLPVVLMSAKAERIRDQFLRQTGALDAITKPFDARGLIAVVEGVLQRAAEGRVPPSPDASQMENEDVLSKSPDSLPPSSVVLGQLQSSTRARSDLAATLAAVIGPALQAEHASVLSNPQALQRAIEGSLVPDVVGQILQKLRWLTLAPDRDVVLYGDISSVPIGEILQVLQMQRQTGTLEVSDGKMEVSIALRDGLVDMAQARKAAPEFLLGRYFLDLGVVDARQLSSAVQEAAAAKALLGNVLVQKRLVNESQLRTALIRQTSETIYEVLRWQRGWFLLRRDVRSAVAEAAALALPVASIVMEGFRRVDEWRIIEESINFDDVLYRNDQVIHTLRSDELTRQEQQVLDAVDDRRTVREIIDETHQSSFDICKTLYRFLQSRIVRRRAT
jgi:DNA-binding response OmpR family regulator